MQLTVNGSTIFYRKEGSGKEALLLFHGFGQDNTIFSSLARSISSKYTCYIFDLFFHGQSVWRDEDVPLQKADWKDIMIIFLSTENLGRISLLGYSMGAKLVLATLETLPERIEEVFLIAPDGVNTNFWYKVATYPSPLRLFFKSLILNPKRFTQVAETLEKFKLVDSGVIRFAEYQMGTEEKRRRVYYSWMAFRKLRFNISKIANLINTHKIPVTFILGEYDKVIQPKDMNNLLKRLTKYNLEILKTGHQLIWQSAPYIKPHK